MVETSTVVAAAQSTTRPTAPAVTAVPPTATSARAAAPVPPTPAATAVPPAAGSPTPTAAAAPAASALARITVSYRLDPWLITGTYAGETWVSPPVLGPTTQGGSSFVLQVRAQGVDAQGSAVATSPRWTPTDPEMVTVTPNQGNPVIITVRRAGHSILGVTYQGGSKELRIEARYVSNALQVEIAQ